MCMSYEVQAKNLYVAFVTHVFRPSITCLQVDDETNKICDEDRSAIKANVVNIMLQSPEQYQKQLSEAISIIGNLINLISIFVSNVFFCCF